MKKEPVSRNVDVPDLTSGSLHRDTALGWTIAVFWAAHAVGRVWEGNLYGGRNQEGG